MYVFIKGSILAVKQDLFLLADDGGVLGTQADGKGVFLIQGSP
jgi:hypothetical protein